MSQPLEYEQVSYNAPDGSQFGKTSTEKISFWGATPIIRGTSTVANISTTAFRSTAGLYGFDTSTEGLQVTAALSTIIVQLKAVGLLT